MIITDFDGTLFSDSHTVSDRDYETFIRLGMKNIPRIIATGRSLYSALKVIPEDFPIDYLVFSSGAGVVEWKGKKILKKHNLTREQIKTGTDILIKKNYDFMLHKAIPDNHFFYYRMSQTPAPDFLKRCEVYRKYTEELNIDYLDNIAEGCQFIIILPDNNEIHFKEISLLFNNLKVIRATSPLDKKSMWVEVFPAEVSKAKAAQWIAEKLDTAWEETAAIGNDYNDIDMLSWASKSYVVSNAPEELKNKFIVVASNNESGFSEAVEKWEIKRRINGSEL